MTPISSEAIELAAPERPAASEIVRSTGPLVSSDWRGKWSQPSIVFYTLQVQGHHFRGTLQSCPESPFTDELGYSFEEMQLGEAEIAAGLGVPHEDAMNALRARVRSQGH